MWKTVWFNAEKPAPLFWGWFFWVWLIFVLMMQEFLKDINWELERQVILFAASENSDLYELPSEFGRYNFKLPERIFLTYSIVLELLSEGLVSLDEYETAESTNPVRTVESFDYSKILDNPFNWYPCGKPVYSIGITTKGDEYLDRLSEEAKENLRKRLFAKI